MNTEKNTPVYLVTWKDANGFMWMQSEIGRSNLKDLISSIEQCGGKVTDQETIEHI